MASISRCHILFMVHNVVTVQPPFACRIMNCRSNALTITCFLKGQRIPSPFLIASQLTNYPPKNVIHSFLFLSNSSAAHLNSFSYYASSFFFLSYNKEQVTSAMKTPFLPNRQIRKFITEQRSCLSLPVIVCGCAVLASCMNIKLWINSLLHTNLNTGSAVCNLQAANTWNLQYSYTFVSQMTSNQKRLNETHNNIL